MLRNTLIKKYVNTNNDIQWVIGHSSIIYIKKAVLTIVLLFFVYVIFVLLNRSNPAEYWKRIFGTIGLGLFAKWVIDFLNTYLDCLILTKDSVILFLWEGLLEYKTEVFGWNKINTISWNQNGLWDKIFAKGDILIKLEFDTDFPFSEVHSPKKQAGKLLMLKENFLSKQKQKIENDLSEDNEKYSILVEAMSEVIKDYLDKKDN